MSSQSSTISFHSSLRSAVYQVIIVMKSSRVRRICSELSRLALATAVVALSLLTPASSSAQLYTTTSSTDAWNSARWSTDSGGPFTSAWVTGTSTSFVTSGTYTFGSMFSTTGTIGDITTGTNVTIGFTNSTSQQYGFGGAIKTFDVGAGSVIDFGGIALLGTGGNGLVKNGAGSLTMSGGNYQAGLTLNAGNMVARTNNGFGTGAFNINGGAIGSTTNITSPSARINGINIGGDFQIGISGSTGSASSTANMTLSGTGSVVSLGGSTRKITLGSSGSMTFGGVISNGGLTLTRNADGAAGSFGISGVNTFTGGLTIDGVKVNASTSNAALGDGPVTLGGATGFDSTLNIKAALTLANNITIANSAGTKTITNSGVDALISGSITNNDSTGGLQIGSTTGRVFTLANGIGGTATTNLLIGGTSAGSALSGAVTINGASTYLGDTSINSAKVNLGVNNALAQNDLTLLGTAILDLNGFSQTVTGFAGDSASKVQSTGSLGTLVVSNSTSSTYAGTISGTSGSVALTKLGVGDLVLSGSNSFSGGTTLGAGTLSLGNASALGSTGTITFNGGSLQSSASNTADYSARFSNAANQAYRIDTNGQTVTLASNLTSSGGTFTKLGGGSAILTGTSSYSGATTVSGGALVINGSLTSSAVTVENLATLGGRGTIASSVTVLAGGTISPGNSPGLLTVGSLDLRAGSTTLMQIIGVGSTAGTAGTDYDKLAITTAGGLGYGGTLDFDFANTATFLDGTTFSLFGFSGSPTGTFSSVTSTGTGSYGGLTFAGLGGVWTATLGNQLLRFTEATGQLEITATAVPEPTTWAMALMGAGFAGWMARRKKLTRNRRIA